MSKEEPSVCPIGDKEYVKEGGLKCPWCGSEEIEGRHIEVDDGIARQSISCLNCKKEWEDKYDLVGYEEIR